MRMARGVVAHILVFDGQFHTRAIGELSHILAIDFLPGCLVNQIGLFPVLFALGEFSVADEDIGRVCVEVNAHAVTRLEKGKATAHCGFGRGVEYGRAGRSAALTSIADAGQFGNARLHEAIGREHVDDFGRAGIAHGSAIAHEEHGIFVDG